MRRFINILKPAVMVMTAFLFCISFCICLTAKARTAPPIEKSTWSKGTFLSPEGPLSLADQQELQASATVNETTQPLTEVLQKLSEGLSVTLTAERRIGDQRVTIQVKNEPLYRLMERLCGLLSHAPHAPHGYFWEKVAVTNDKHIYRLRRDRASLREEWQALDYPRQRAREMLGEFQKLIRMTPEERASYDGDLEKDLATDSDLALFRDAVRPLTAAQLDALVRGETIPLNPAVFAAQITAFNVQWRESALRSRQEALAAEQPNLFPAGVPETPPLTAGLSFHEADFNGNRPNLATQFGLFLQGVRTLDLAPGMGGNMNLAFNPLYRKADIFPDDPDASAARKIDLKPLLTAEGVTDRERGDVGFILAALAQTADISIYQEHFLKTDRFSNLSSGLRVTNGTVPQLIRAICDNWDYQAKKVDGIYYFWSRTWAQDRANDIAERNLEPWRRRLKQQKAITTADRVAIASQFTWPQVRLTLNMALPETGPWQQWDSYKALRFWGFLSDAERQQLTQDWFPVSRMPWPARQEVERMLLARIPTVMTDADRRQMALHYTPSSQDSGLLPGKLQVRSAAHLIWQGLVQ